MNAIEEIRIAKTAGEVVNHFCAIVDEMGMILYSLVDHAKDMKARGVEDAPTAYTVIFGNPLAGAKVLSAHPGAVVDIPLRVGIYASSDQAETVVVCRSMNHLFHDHEESALEGVGMTIDQILQGMITRLVDYR